MTSEQIVANSFAGELAGSTTHLAKQLGSPAVATDLVEACAMLYCSSVSDRDSLRRVLEAYRSQVLLSQELPAIHAAYEHAKRGEFRELLALDFALAQEPWLEPFAAASRRTGRGQLRRLRPLRDHRMVQRYLAAVENGEANGWHTIVFGLILALYSVPLRQGLAHYAQSTLRGFIQAKAAPLRLTEAASDELWEEVCAPVQAAVNSMTGTTLAVC